jgi:hypothetical protein
MDFSHLKYAGEAIFLLGAAFRLLHWAVSALAEGDAPPSASIDYSTPAAPSLLSPLFPGATGPSGVDSTSTTGAIVSPHVPAKASALTHIGATLMAPVPPTSLLSTLGMLAAKQQDPEAPPHAGDPVLFPQSMLDAMTPEQQAQVISTLVKQRSGGIPG